VEVVSRKEAISRGLKHYFTGQPCKHGHVSDRFVASKKCRRCGIEQNAEWMRNNPEQWKAISRNSKRRTYNTVRNAESCRRFTEKNRDNPAYHERNAMRAAAWREKNPERAHAIQRAYKESHRGVLAARTSERKGRQRHATPQWANLAAIELIYREAAAISARSGVTHHVDHYFPLKGETVCGLHVENNLRVIPWIDNIRKSNRLPTEA